MFDLVVAVEIFVNEDEFVIFIYFFLYRTTASADADVPSSSHPARLPTFHARYFE